MMSRYVCCITAVCLGGIPGHRILLIHIWAWDQHYRHASTCFSTLHLPGRLAPLVKSIPITGKPVTSDPTVELTEGTLKAGGEVKPPLKGLAVGLVVKLIW